MNLPISNGPGLSQFCPRNVLDGEDVPTTIIGGS